MGIRCGWPNAPHRAATWRARMRRTAATLVLAAAVVEIGAVSDQARAQCVLCRCIYSTDFYGTPVRTSSPFAAQGSPECSARCTDIRLNCVFPGGACYPITSRRVYQVLGGLPENQCPNPPPYTAPYRRGSVVY
jgi:hypothetical protein